MTMGWCEFAFALVEGLVWLVMVGVSTAGSWGGWEGVWGGEEGPEGGRGGGGFGVEEGGLIEPPPSVPFREKRWVEGGREGEERGGGEGEEKRGQKGSVLEK